MGEWRSTTTAKPKASAVAKLTPTKRGCRGHESTLRRSAPTLWKTGKAGRKKKEQQERRATPNSQPTQQDHSPPSQKGEQGQPEHTTTRTPNHRHNPNKESEKGHRARQGQEPTGRKKNKNTTKKKKHHTTPQGPVRWAVGIITLHGEF